MSNYQSIGLQLAKTLDVGNRSTLLERIQRLRGVTEAALAAPDFRRLTVTYRSGALSPATLQDLLAYYGLTTALAKDETA